jgi:hypothetical protein
MLFNNASFLAFDHDTKDIYTYIKAYSHQKLQCDPKKWTPLVCQDLSPMSKKRYHDYEYANLSMKTKLHLIPTQEP